MSHKGFMGKKRGIDPCAYVPGLYTEAEVDDLINNEGYIPVATPEEFNLLPTGLAEHMGGCSKWAGNYTTGSNKKYVQIFDLDFEGMPDHLEMDVVNILYDGNRKEFIRMEGESMFFEARAGSFMFEIKNMVIKNCHFEGINKSVSVLLRSIADAPVRISNCDFIGITSSCTSTSGLPGSGIVVGALLNSLILEDCHIENCQTDRSNTLATGLFVGVMRNTDSHKLTVLNCSARNSTTSNTTKDCAVLFGGSDSTNIVACEIEINNLFVDSVTTLNFNNINSALLFSGFRLNAAVSIKKLTIKDCILPFGSDGRSCAILFGVQVDNGITDLEEIKIINSAVNVNGAGGSTQAAGIVCGFFFSGTLNIKNIQIDSKSFARGRTQSAGIIGDKRNGVVNIENSYSAAEIHPSPQSGGLIGAITGSGSVNITDTYWDTVTSGQSVSAGGGTGQTTSQLQTPTSNTGIYSAWTIPPWDFGTASEYPTLTTTP